MFNKRKRLKLVIPQHTTALKSVVPVVDVEYILKIYCAIWQLKSVQYYFYFSSKLGSLFNKRAVYNNINDWIHC